MTMPSYCGTPPLPADILARWNLDPLVLAGLAIAAVCASRLGGVRRQAGLAGVAMLGLAFVSPLCALSVALFSARALHHLLIVAVAAPLLAVAWPGRRAMPAVAMLALSTVTLWVWHVPATYDAALADVGLYWAMQVTLLVTAWAFWASVGRASAPVAAVAIVGGAAQMGMLGALLTFAPQPLYASHLATTLPYGIGPLGDQQLAGLIMWVIGLVPYAVIGWWRLGGAWRRMAAA